MPVGTQGAVKAITHRDLEGLGAEIMLGNTYHLYLRPGAERIGRLGGLHTFIGWNRAILTDSGGYQVFSLAARRNVHEDGVTFRSHLDGSEHVLTPERVVDIQACLGSDIAMVLDECLEHPATHARAKQRVKAAEPAGPDGPTHCRPCPASLRFGLHSGLHPGLRVTAPRPSCCTGCWR